MRVLLFLATVVIFQPLISFFFPLMDGPREAGLSGAMYATRVLKPDLWLLME